MPKVWFIRHGESISNADLPTKHPAESQLTARGHEEGQQIAQAFIEAPDLIVTSPYVRARETAVPTCARFPQTPVEEWPVYEFTYLHPERYNSTTGSQRAPLALAYWERNNPLEKENGEGESFAELWARAQQTIIRLQTSPAAFIALFSHGLFLRTLLFLWLTPVSEATPETMRRYRHFVQAVWMPNGAILEATWAKDGRVHFTGFDTAHMQHQGTQH